MIQIIKKINLESDEWGLLAMAFILLIAGIVGHFGWLDF